MLISPTNSSTAQASRTPVESRAASVSLPVPGSSGNLQPVVASAPVETTNAVEATTKAPAAPEVQDAVKAINDTMTAMARNIEFSYDADINRMIVTVVDQQTKEVIQQMPTKDALDIARALDKVQGLLVRQKA